MLLALGVLGVSCARGPGPEHDPRPQRMIPAWGLNTGPVPVVIQGENFLALATQHIGGGELVSVDTRFQAFLDEVALEDVTLEDVRTLRARVPGGLAPGWHTLAVVGPLGRRAELPRAYFSSDRSLALLGARAVLERDRVGVGERTWLLLAVRNEGGTAALAVTPVPRMVGEGRGEVLSEPEPADIVPGESASFAWEIEAAAPGELRFTVEVRGHEATSGVELPVLTVEAGPLWVRDRAPPSGHLEARFTVPARVNVGRIFDVELEVTNPGSSTVLGVRPVAMASSGEGRVALVSGPEPARVDVPGKGRAVFRGRLIGIGEGPCTLRAGAAGLDQADGFVVEASPVDSPIIEVE